jgi:hypothetical protein
MVRSMALPKPLAWERRAAGSPWLLLRLPGVLGELWEMPGDMQAFLVVVAASMLTGIIEVGLTLTPLWLTLGLAILVHDVRVTEVAGTVDGQI